jgi:siroheme synthase-like protein
MGFYPVVLELAERSVLVIGGGGVAERKVEGLLAAGARVTVVSPTLTDRLSAWAHEGRMRWMRTSYRRGDLAGQALVFVATDDGDLNAEIAGEARACGIWVNAADDPEHCDFILPSVLRRGTLTVAVSTDGTCPALSRMIRERLEEYFVDEFTTLAHKASEARRDLREGRLLARLLERLRAAACA